MNIFNVKDTGADGNEKTKDTPAIQKSIDMCTNAGGGMVYFPPGEYLSGTIYLKDNVDLHVEAGAKILGSPDLEDYFVPEGIDHTSREALYHIHLICAKNAKNIAISGRGTIDGNGRAFFDPPTPDRTHFKVREWRPGHMIALKECCDILIRDINLVDSPCYTIWPLACERVKIHAISIFNDLKGCPVFDTAPRLNKLHFGQYASLPGTHPLQFHQRRIANKTCYIL